MAAAQPSGGKVVTALPTSPQDDLVRTRKPFIVTLLSTARKVNE